MGVGWDAQDGLGWDGRGWKAMGQDRTGWDGILGMGLGVERAGLGQGYEIESGMGQDGIVMDTVRCRIGYLEEIGWDCVVGLLATGHQGLI